MDLADRTQGWVGLNVTLSGAAEVPAGTSVPASGCYHLGPKQWWSLSSNMGIAGL